MQLRYIMHIILSWRGNNHSATNYVRPRCNAAKRGYRIGVETGIAHSIISRFINQGAGLSLANVDKLCECIGAELMLKGKAVRKYKKG